MVICTSFLTQIVSMEIEKTINSLEPSNFTRFGVLLEKRVKKELQTILDQAKGEKEDILTSRKKGSNIMASQHRLVETLEKYLESLRKNISINEINDRLNYHYRADNDKELWDSLIHIIPGATLEEDFKIKRDLVKKIELKKAIALYMNLTDMRNEFYGARHIDDKKQYSDHTVSKKNNSKDHHNKKNNQQCVGS